MVRDDGTSQTPATGVSTWGWDLVGLPWAEAQPILDARGQRYETRVTAPPNRPVGTGEMRVVAQRPRPDGLLVILAHREYQRPAP